MNAPVEGMLRASAGEAARRAYAPYSNCRVGAAVRTAGGSVHLGCNVENAVFGLGSCAERSAIAAAVLAEGRAIQLLDVAIVAIDADGSPRPAPPCGACRQLLLELGADCEVEFMDASGHWQRQRIGQLLPFPFSLHANCS